MSGERAMTIQETVIHRITNNKTCEGPDLTTPDGAFWMMTRLEGWDRFEEFCVYGKAHLRHLIVMFPDAQEFVIKQVTASLLTWLASDAKDGKAPALFNALCEFEGLEVEG